MDVPGLLAGVAGQVQPVEGPAVLSQLAERLKHQNLSSGWDALLQRRQRSGADHFGQHGRFVTTLGGGGDGGPGGPGSRIG